jgi:hypothetical protein
MLGLQNGDVTISVKCRRIKINVFKYDGGNFCIKCETYSEIWAPAWQPDWTNSVCPKEMLRHFSWVSGTRVEIF